MKKKKDNSWLKGINNEKEIKDNIELYLNENKIDFCLQFPELEKKFYNTL